MKDALDKRQRRSRVPVSEKLKAIDDQMAALEARKSELRMRREMIVEAHRAKIKAMEAEVE